MTEKASVTSNAWNSRAELSSMQFQFLGNNNKHVARKIVKGWRGRNVHKWIDLHYCNSIEMAKGNCEGQKS